MGIPVLDGRRNHLDSVGGLGGVWAHGVRVLDRLVHSVRCCAG